MRKRTLFSLAVILLYSVSFSASAQDGILNFDAIAQSLNFPSYYQSGGKVYKRPKISILDRGFSGYEAARGKSISSNAVYFHGSHEAAEDVIVRKEVHGLYMAKLIYLFMTENGKRPELEPELYLHDAYGFTNFQTSVQKAIELKSDIILYSQVWDYFDNFDGTGMINPVVSQAVQAGIIWVNAAGNYGRNVFNIPKIETTSEGWIQLPEAGNTLSLRCTPPVGQMNSCVARIVISWNSFPDQPGKRGTDKDLDVSLFDPSQPIAIQASNLVQKSDPTQPVGESKYSRDIIEAQLKPGLYYIKIKNKSQNFSSGDRARVAVSGDFVDLLSADTQENIFNPANHSDVITVGAQDDARSSSSAKSSKPDVKLPGMVQFSDLQIPALGSSTAAAIAAAGVGLMKGYQPHLRAKDIRSKAIWNGVVSLGQGLLLDKLGFQMTGTNCFKPLSLPSTPAYLIPILSQGGVMVETTHGFKIALINSNPLVRAPGAPSTDENQYRVFIAPDGFKFLARNASQGSDPLNWIEIFQLPLSQSICGYISQNTSRSDKAFQLP